LADGFDFSGHLIVMPIKDVAFDFDIGGVRGLIGASEAPVDLLKDVPVLALTRMIS